ncbi:MAG: glycerol-3-phosphate acyltransferase, partial [Syntrophomonadaceae bacterium]|nr:glycerol-3-phosphate acyltransferase [Syntrophomonadaceae bacterium]
MKVVFVLTASYLLGSIPWGYLVGVWWKGLDIRRYGSGNIGTTNAFRILGPGPGTVVLLGDILKGTLAVLLAKSIGSELLAVAAGLAAIAGHSWSIFLGFRGGRGVATGAGVILGLVPLAIPVLFLLWAGTILVTRYVSVGSITAAVAAPVVMGWVGHS